MNGIICDVAELMKGQARCIDISPRASLYADPPMFWFGKRRWSHHFDAVVQPSDGNTQGIFTTVDRCQPNTLTLRGFA